MRSVERVLSPFLVATQVIPKVAIISFFVMMQNTILGIRSIEASHRDLMRVIQAPWWKRVISLDIPSSLPAVLTGTCTSRPTSPRSRPGPPIAARTR